MEWRAAKELAGTLDALEFSVPNQDVAALHHDLRQALDRHALVATVVHVHVVGLRRERPLHPWVEDHEIGVAPRRDRALAGEETEHLGGRRRHQLDEAVERDPPRIHAAVEDERKAIFHTGQAVGDLGEVAATHLLLAFEVERTVVSRDQLEVVLQQTLPELVMMRWRSQWWRADVLGAFETGPPQIVEAEVEVLRAGLGKGRGAVVAGLAHRVQGLFRAQVHDVDRDLRQSGEGNRSTGGLPLHRGGPREAVVDGISLSLPGSVSRGRRWRPRSPRAS